MNRNQLHDLWVQHTGAQPSVAGVNALAEAFTAGLAKGYQVHREPGGEIPVFPKPADLISGIEMIAADPDPEMFGRLREAIEGAVQGLIRLGSSDVAAASTLNKHLARLCALERHTLGEVPKGSEPMHLDEIREHMTKFRRDVY